MTFEEFELIANISTASALIPLVLGLVRFNRISSELKLLLGLTGVSIICDTASYVLRHFHINPNYASSIYVLTEFAILFVIYYKAFEGKKLVSRLFVFSGGLYFIFFLLNLFFFQKEGINSYSVVISSLIFIVLSIVYFYKLMVDLPTLQVYRLPMFWINVAVLVYFAGNLFLFTLSHYLVHTMNDNLILYWSFHNALTIVRNILFAIAFYMGIRPPQNSL